MRVDYEWDESKARSNLAKHGIDLADAVAVLEDTLALTLEDKHAGEVRFVTVGRDALGRLLVVVWAWRGDDVVRLISARNATPSERRRYEGAS